MQSILEKKKSVFDKLKDKFNYSNVMQAPQLEKVVINVGVGSIGDKNKIDIIQDRLAKITGQKTAPRASRKSVAGFKVREGDIVGYQITLRGEMMNSFLDKLINIALPRTKDFRGLSPKGIDEMGNLTIGIKEHTVFPETSDEELKDIFGFAVTVVTTAKTKDEARTLFDHFGFPFKKD